MTDSHDQPQPVSRPRKVLKGTGAGILAVLLIVAVAEGFTAWISTDVEQPDPFIGWRTIPDLDITLSQVTGQGHRHVVHYETDSAAARTVEADPDDTGRPEAMTPRHVLVIGNDLTMAPLTSNKDAWFGVFAHHWAKQTGQRITVSAIGGQGYSTLQEWMVTDAFQRQRATPDMMIVQFCPADYIRNTQQWESHSPILRYRLRRPYLGANLSAISFNHGTLAALYRSRLARSALFRLVDRLLTDSPTPLIHRQKFPEPLASSQAEQAQIVDQSNRITVGLLTRLRTFAGKNPAYIFSCHGWASLDRKMDWEDQVEQAGFQVLRMPPAFAYKAAHDRQDVFNADGTVYGLNGQALIGKAVADEIRDLQDAQ